MTALYSLLQDIQTQSQQLLDCLSREKKALDKNQLEDLAQIADQKQILLEQLDRLDKQRAANSCEKNFDAFIIKSSDPKLKTQWKSTRNSIIACQQQNEINGRLINKRSLMNQDILAILSGRNQPSDNTYNAKGNQTSKTSLYSGIKA